jgi:hypothetical protein
MVLPKKNTNLEYDTVLLVDTIHPTPQCPNCR